jgi:hypothetical protein
MTPLAPEPRHSVEALSFLYVCLGGRADGEYDSTLKIHVPQALAADGCAHVLCIQCGDRCCNGRAWSSESLCH